jgi:hypothetical protein
MSDPPKVRELRPREFPAVVALLEQVLADARAGHVSAIAIVGECGQQTRFARSGEWNVPSLLFALETARFELMMTSYERAREYHPQPES